MDKGFTNQSTQTFDAKYSLDQKSKCQRNIWTLKMTESEIDEYHTVDAKVEEPQTIEPQTAELQSKKSQIDELQTTGAEAVKSETVKDNEIELQTIELKSVVKPRTTESQNVNPLTHEPRSVEPDILEPQIVENHESLHQERDSQPSSSSLSDHKSLVIWRYPILTLLYFLKELFIYIRDMILKIAQYHRILHVIITMIIIITYLNSAHGSYHPTLFWAQKKLLWCLYWLFLGMLSSVGLGTGIHTFALYLGPYIASVTVAANECGYLNFVEDSLQGGIECPDDPDPRWAATLWNIMCKVRLESYMWGLGTAVGELPPYFMGRAARISKEEERTEVLREFEELERKKDGCPESLTRLDRVKLFVRDLVVKAGFWGILACASVPNPFFDLAGITCGNFLVPFWTFFGATLIGKAVIKITIQQVFVILSFNKAFLAGVVDILSKVPLVGQRLQTHFSQYIVKQKEKFSRDRIEENPASGWFSKAYHIFVIFTFLYFFISIINSLAQNHHKRLIREKQKDK